MIHCQGRDAIMAFLPSRGHLCHPAQKRGHLTTVVKVLWFHPDQNNRCDFIFTFWTGFVVESAENPLWNFTRFQLIHTDKPTESLHPFTWNCPSVRKGSHGKGTGSPVVNVQLWETRESIWHREHSIHYIPAQSQSRRTFTNVSLWKLRCWSAVCALQKDLAIVTVMYS